MKNCSHMRQILFRRLHRHQARSHGRRADGKPTVGRTAATMVQQTTSSDGYVEKLRFWICLSSSPIRQRQLLRIVGGTHVFVLIPASFQWVPRTASTLANGDAQLHDS